MNPDIKYLLKVFACVLVVIGILFLIDKFDREDPRFSVSTEYVELVKYFIEEDKENATLSLSLVSPTFDSTFVIEGGEGVTAGELDSLFKLFVENKLSYYPDVIEFPGWVYGDDK